MNKPLFFTGKNCPACVIAKKYADEREIPYKLMDMDIRENAQVAAKFMVMGKPTLIVLDGKGHPQRSFHGSSCFSAYMKWKEQHK